MTQLELTAEEVLNKIMDSSDEENNDMDEICSVTSNNDVDDTLSTAVAVNEVEQIDDLAEVSTAFTYYSTARTSARLPTRNRLVYNLESALDERNYEKFSPPETSKIYSSYLQKPKNSDLPRQKITWTNSKPTVGKQTQANIIAGTTGVRAEAKYAKNPLQAWMLFFTTTMLDLIVFETNRKIKKFTERFHSRSALDNPYNYLDLTSPTEIQALIGLMYMRGLLGQANHNTENFFHETLGNPVFSATMSKNRFKFLMSHISFDNCKTRSDRWLHDRFAAFREVFEEFNFNCGKYVVPDDYLTLDETLYPTRAHISFKQFNPNKPAKYGMLYKSINASQYPYTFITSVYAGKPRAEPTIYYTPGTEHTVKSLIQSLECHTNLQGRNLSYDRFYSSLSLAEWLLTRGITSVGTIQSNRKGIPAEIKQIDHREVNSYEVYWEEDKNVLNLHSYVVKTKSSGKRNVLLLSAVTPLLGTTKDDQKRKPGIYKLYDFTKGGTDVVDQRIGFYSCRSKSRRWTVNSFSYVLDTCRVNAGTVYAMNNDLNPRSIKSLEFGLDLAMLLIRPHIECRSLTGLNFSVLRKIEIVLGQKLEKYAKRSSGLFPASSEKRRRCADCLSDIAGEGAKEKKRKMNKQLSQCQKCCKPVCKKHFVRLCDECL